MRPFSRLCVGLVLAMASLTLWSADEASAALTRTRDNLTRWSAKGKRLGLRQGRQVRAARRHQLDANHAIHAVDFEGGGFAITSAKDGSDKVIAFSGSGSFSAATNSPLWALLKRDVARRDAAPLTRKPLLAAAVPVEAPEQLDDLRVAPLVKTKWGQAYLMGEGPGGMDLNFGFALDTAGNRIPCYNYYTPKGYYTGCVATAMAQILHTYQYPASSTAFEHVCDWKRYDVDWNVIESGRTNLVVTAHPYNWSTMPLHPSVDNIAAEEAGRRAISQVMHDCGAALDMSYSNGGSGSTTSDVAGALKSRFGYENAKYLVFRLDEEDPDLKKYYGQNGGILAEIRQRTICSNLDAGCPVQLGISYDYFEEWGEYLIPWSDNSHSIVADGYGYSSGTLYTHLNMGWDGESDIWYNLPEIDCNYDDPTSGNYFNAISTIVYNIFPEGTGEIVSGRVFGTDGAVATNATVKAYQDDVEKGTATANDKGIYALRLAAGAYRLEATAPGYSFTTNVTVIASQDPTENMTDQGFRTFGVCGNIWGADLNLGVAETPSTEPDYIVIAPPAYVELWKWYVEERAKLPGGQGYTFDVKNAQEIYDAYPYDKTYTDGKPRNPAESIHKWIGEQAKKGTKYFVLGGRWFDAQNLDGERTPWGNRGNLETEIPGIVTYPFTSLEYAGFLNVNPSDLYYACHFKEPDAKYVWDPNGDGIYVGLREGITYELDEEGNPIYVQDPINESWNPVVTSKDESKNDHFTDPRNFQPTVIVSRISFYEKKPTRSFEEMVHDYLEKLKHGEASEFAGKDSYSVWVTPCLGNDAENRPDVYGVMKARYDAIDAYRETKNQMEFLVRMGDEVDGDSRYTNDLNKLLNGDWEVFLPYGHGTPDAFAAIDSGAFAGNSGLIKFFMGNVPCLTGSLNADGNAAMIGLANPSGGILASVNNTSYGWASPSGIQQRYKGVSDELIDWCMDAYIRDNTTAGEAWRRAIAKYSGIVFDPKTGDAEIAARDYGNDKDCVYAAVVEQVLFGDPLVKIDYAATPTDDYPEESEDEPPATTVVATVTIDGVTNAFASFDAAMDAATNTTEDVRLTIEGNVNVDSAVLLPSTVTLELSAGSSLTAPSVTIAGTLRGPGTLGGAISFVDWALVDASNGPVALAPDSTLTFSEYWGQVALYAIGAKNGLLFKGDATMANKPTVYRYDSYDGLNDNDYDLNILQKTVNGFKLTDSAVTVEGLPLYSVADAIAYVADWELSLSDIVITDANVELPTGYALKDNGDNTWGVYKQGKVPKVLFR